MPREAHATTDDEIVDRLRSTSRLIDASLVGELRGRVVSLAQLIVLRTLARSKENEGCSSIARKLGCTRQNIEQIVVRLLRKGWVDVLTYERRPWQRDVKITDAGREALANANVWTSRVAASTAAALTPEDEATLRALLEKLARSVMDVMESPGEVRRVEGRTDPNPFLDGYVTREVVGRMKRAAEEERWSGMSRIQRAAYQHSEMWGEPPEKILRDWGYKPDGTLLDSS